MNKLPHLFLAAATVLSINSTGIQGQDAELGIILPPPPNLDLGDPDRKLSWREKRKIAKAEEDLQRQQNTYIRNPQEDQYRSFGDRLLSAGPRAADQTIPSRPTEIDVRNSMPSYDDAVTASGSVLQAFGEEGTRWEGMPAPPPEETLIVLPPLPDLRTPDQITAKERFRNRRLAKYEAKRAEEEAKERERELRERARVTLPEADPSTALVQVQSMAGYEENYVGNVAAPETVDQGNLKPFNSESEFYQNQQLVYKGNKRKDPAQLWWKRGTNQPGGTVTDGPKWEWTNPFRRTNDDVQPVSFTAPDGGDNYSAVTPTLDSTPLTSNLSGIVIHGSTREVVGGPGSVSKAGIYGVTGIESTKIQLPPRVVEVLEARLGRPLTLGELNQMVRDAVVAYRKSDFPVVDVLVPEQEISTGVLQLVIIEGRLGDVIVEGTGNSEAKALASQIRTQPGEVIRESKLTEDLAWINKHPTRQVDLIFTPGGGYGETDVILRSEEYKALSAYMAYENSGTQVLGESRAIFGASWTGPIFFDPNAILSYQFTTNFDNSDANLFGHSGVFASYLPWRHQITLLGAYTESSAAFNNGNGAFSSNGTNKQASGRYGIALPTIAGIAHELEFGMDFKSSNSDLAFNNLQVFDTTSEIVQYSLGYNIVARDRTGAWRVDTEFISSPGDNTNKNTDAIFMTQRPGALANYTYGRASIERDQQLPEGWSAFARLQAQASNRNLLASETLGAGGYDSVRGFEQRVIRGDSGVVGTAELRTPTFYPSTLAGYNNVEDGAFGLLFYDAAALSQKDPLPFEQDLRAGSVGVGFRYQRENWFTLRVDYGVQVTEDGFQDGQDGRWHVGARATF